MDGVSSLRVLCVRVDGHTIFSVSPAGSVTVQYVLEVRIRVGRFQRLGIRTTGLHCSARRRQRCRQRYS